MQPNVHSVVFTALIPFAFGADVLAAAMQAEPATTTERELKARRARFLQDALLADYRSRRTTESPAVPDAEAALRAYGEVYASGVMRFAAYDRVARLARRALQHGEDPALLFAAGDGAYMTSDFERGGVLLQRAVGELEQTSRRRTPCTPSFPSRLRR